MVMQEYFDCGVFEISLLYMGAGLAALVIYSSVAFFSKNMRDSTLQLIGYVLFTAAHVWLIVVLPMVEQGELYGKSVQCLALLCHVYESAAITRLIVFQVSQSTLRSSPLVVCLCSLATPLPLLATMV